MSKKSTLIQMPAASFFLKMCNAVKTKTAKEPEGPVLRKVNKPNK